ncbi:MAG: hypothetical protein M3157_06075 [Actinomycetota bacterium]|nr:hypothetical protein [Actinomycetota bacterium]
MDVREYDDWVYYAAMDLYDYLEDLPEDQEDYEKKLLERFPDTEAAEAYLLEQLSPDDRDLPSFAGEQAELLVALYEAAREGVEVYAGYYGKVGDEGSYGFAVGVTEQESPGEERRLAFVADELDLEDYVCGSREELVTVYEGIVEETEGAA